MKCPDCHKDIPDTAVRCKYCRHPVSRPSKNNEPQGVVSGGRQKNFLKEFFTYGIKKEQCPWSLLDVIVFFSLVAILISNDFFDMGLSIVRVLRQNFQIFTRDQRLLYYIIICVNTIILKIISLIFILIIVKLRKVSFAGTVISPGKQPTSWGTWMLPLYISICLVLRAFVLSSPLTANIPFDSVFPDAKIIGNIILVFSIICIAPFVEEVIFRGFLYPAFNKYMGIYPAIIFTSILFTAAHYTQTRPNYIFIIVLFALSGIITYARAVTGSTRMAIVMHAIYNSVSLAVGFIDHLIF